MSKKLVAYFSASGITRNVAKMVAEAAGADLYEITPKEAYTKADLNWMDKKSRSSVEMADKKIRPEITDTDAKIAEYDEIFLGFPIWWYIGRAGVQSKVSTVAERSFSSKAIWEAEAVSSRVSRTGSLSCSYGSHSQAHWPSAKRVSSDRLHANFIFFITVFFVVADTVRNLPDTFLSDPPGGGDEGF